MILRQTANAGIHLVGGVVLGVTVVLAACTVAQLASQMRRPPMPGMRPPEPPRPPEAPRAPEPETVPGRDGLA